MHSTQSSLHKKVAPKTNKFKPHLKFCQIEDFKLFDPEPKEEEAEVQLKPVSEVSVQREISPAPGGSQQRRDVEGELRRAVEHWFAELDTQKRGYLDKAKIALIVARLQKRPITASEFGVAWRELDGKKDGKIGLETLYLFFRDRLRN
jgi:BMFP domain-containing protein YqiC